MSTLFRNRLLDSVLYVFIALCVFMSLLPMWHIIAISLSSNDAILSGKVYLLPVEFNLKPYLAVFQDPVMIRALYFSVILVVLYTALSLLMTICCAYPLTRHQLPGRKFFLLAIVFTMFFNAGLIPDYLLVRDLKLLNSIWALILPQLINPFYLLIMITFFRTTIPAEIEESARIDGSSYWNTLVRIVLPLSLPILATMSLFYAVFRWNFFMDALFYISDTKMFTLQLKLNEMITNSQLTDVTALEGANATLPIPESLKAASVMFATVPILLVYPWLQRYFISGMMIGAVKE